MKAYLFAAAAISAALSASPALAAKLCNISIKSPMASGELPFGVPPTFRWLAEPEGTVSRVIIISGDQSLAVAADSKFRLHTKKVLPMGSYSWSLTFSDKDGKVICTTPPVAFAVTEPKPGVVVVDLHEAANRNFTSPPPVVMTSLGPAQVFIRNGRYVIVLQNSTYTGPYTQLINSNNFDGSAFVLPNGIIGLEIHDNPQSNTIVGSPGNDYIYITGGDDVVTPGKGSDTVEVGPWTGNVNVFNADGDTDPAIIIHTTGAVGGKTVNLLSKDPTDGSFHLVP